MKKSFISILIGLLMVGAGGQAWAGNVVAADLNCTNPAGCVQTNEISDGAVTEPKLAIGAITNGKIADGAVTDAKIFGVISGAKLGSHGHYGSDIVDGTITSTKVADGAITDTKIVGPISASKIEKPANVVIVAKSGGDFSSIQTAIDSINPSETNPFVIEIMPGTYTENITMKSYLYLKGAGKEVTIISSPSPSSNVIYLYDIASVVISGLSIKNGAGGIFIEISSSITIKENTMTGNGASVYVYKSSPIIIKGNTIKENNYGIWNRYSPAIITENTITGSNYGISNEWSSSNISGNTITGNNIAGIYDTASMATSPSTTTITENSITDNYYGIFTEGGTLNSLNIVGNIITGNIGSGILNASSTKVIRNVVTGNGVGRPGAYDICGTDFSNISFNVYDTRYGSYAGQYNVKSDGTPIQ